MLREYPLIPLFGGSVCKSIIQFDYKYQNDDVNEKWVSENGISNSFSVT
jgi:hypothetical protein